MFELKVNIFKELISDLFFDTCNPYPNDLFHVIGQFYVNCIFKGGHRCLDLSKERVGG